MEKSLRRASNWIFVAIAVVALIATVFSDDTARALGSSLMTLGICYVLYMFLFELVAAIVRLIRRARARGDGPK